MGIGRTGRAGSRCPAFSRRPWSPTTGALLLALAGCAPDSPPPDASEAAGSPASAESTTQAPTTQTAAQDSVFEAWALNAFLGERATLDSVYASFGPPDSIRRLPQRNEYDSTQVDTLIVAAYDGLEATFYQVTGSHTLFAGADLSDGRFLKDPLIRFGMPSAELLRLFGPSPMDPAGFTYECGSCTDAGRIVTFEFVDGALSRVVFSYYMG